MSDLDANARHSSVTNEHYTPLEVIDAARATMGGIDLEAQAGAAMTEKKDGEMTIVKAR